MQVYDKKIWNDNIGYEASNYLRLTVDTHTTLVVKDQDNNILSDGDLMLEGTVITITATPATNYTLETLAVNGAPFTSGNTLTVRTGINIIATSTNTYKLYIDADAHSTVLVTKGGVTVNDGDDIMYGDSLIATVTYSTGYEKDTLTMNGNAFISGGTITVNSEVDILATSKAQQKTLTITQTNATVVVTHNRTQLNTGDPIYYDDVLHIVATANEGYEISVLTVNGTAIESGSDFTVNANVAIIATAEQISTDIAVGDLFSSIIVDTTQTSTWDELDGFGDFSGNGVVFVHSDRQEYRVEKFSPDTYNVCFYDADGQLYFLGVCDRNASIVWNATAIATHLEYILPNVAVDTVLTEKQSIWGKWLHK